MNDLVSKNKRVIVLLENFLYTRISQDDYKPGCGVGKIDFKNFDNRTTEMVSGYNEDYARDYRDMQELIRSEVDRSYSIDDLLKKLYKDRDAVLNLAPLPMKPSLKRRFDELESGLKNEMAHRPEKYRTYQDVNKLRVMQLVSRPPDLWYAKAATLSDDLLQYATREINKPLSFKDAGSGCAEGWLGKRLRIGIEGDPDKWNAPNIIIADNYLANEWVLPDYQNGQWVASQKGRYVDMAIALNRVDRKARRLKDVSNFDDGQCLN